MGIIDELRAIAGKIFNRRPQNKPSNSYTSEVVTSGVSSPGVKYVGESDEQYVTNILCKLRKFAIVSAVDESLKTVSGGSKIAKEGLKDQSPPRPRLDKQDLTVMMEEMQAKMEKLQDDIYSTKQQNEVSAKCANGLDSFEFSDEPIKSSTPTKSNKKKVFIRSRL